MEPTHSQSLRGQAIFLLVPSASIAVFWELISDWKTKFTLDSLLGLLGQLGLICHDFLQPWHWISLSTFGIDCFDTAYTISVHTMAPFSGFCHFHWIRNKQKSELQICNNYSLSRKLNNNTSQHYSLSSTIKILSHSSLCTYAPEIYVMRICIYRISPQQSLL